VLQPVAITVRTDAELLVAADAMVIVVRAVRRAVPISALLDVLILVLQHVPVHAVQVVLVNVMEPPKYKS